MGRRFFWLVGLCTVLLFAGSATALGWTPVPVKNDPLVFMPGSQPGDASGFETPAKCDNCHGGYNAAVEPAYNWRGSMMAQAARDPLWLACLTVAAQDAVWAVGNPNATDICIRCHAPTGWLEGRSDPTNTSALMTTDYDGVQCDFCHRKIDPLTSLGQPDVAADTGTALTLAAQTKQRDLTVLGGLKLFGGTSPFLNLTSGLPTYYGAFPSWMENGAGQFFADTSNAKSGPFFDAVARHQWFYSRYHKSRDYCHSCHDVSNPVLANLMIDDSATSKFAAASYFHVERTQSEFLLSAYGRDGGASSAITGVPTAAKCQDCHMRDVTGKGASMNNAPVRNDLPLHDLTGGNQWISGILASADPNHAGVYDPYNYAILSGTKYPGAKIEVAGLANYGPALTAGQKRAVDQLKMAATLSEVGNDGTSLTVRITNNTGHKLISGFPEGRRVFLNVKWYAPDGTVVGEINKYDPLVKTSGATDQYVSGGELASATTSGALIWEAVMASSITGEDKSFHVALATSRHKDNRIPPKGFDKAGASARLAEPVIDGASSPNFFTDAECAGGYEDINLAFPAGATTYSATLYYQTTSKVYVEFLRNEINASVKTLPDSAYITQSDPFFTNLKGWGDAIWDLWVHNGGSAPVEMATLGTAPTPPAPITVTAPTNLNVAYNRRTLKVTAKWTAPTSGANGYCVYRSTTKGGPYTKVGTTATTTFTDPGPFTAGATYYYVISAYKTDKLGVVYESPYSTEAAAIIK